MPHVDGRKRKRESDAERIRPQRPTHGTKCPKKAAASKYNFIILIRR